MAGFASGPWRALAAVYSSNLLSRLVVAGVGIALVRYMDARQFAVLTLALSIVMALAHPLADLANRVFIVFAEFGSDGERLTIVAFLQAAAVVVLGIALEAVLGPGSLAPAIVAAILAIVALETAKTWYQSAQRFGVYWWIELARAASFLLAVAALIFWRDHLSAANVLYAQAATGLAIGGVMILPRLDRRLQGGALLRRAGTALRAMGRLDGGASLIAYVALQSLLAQASVFVLGAVSTAVEVASFGAAARYYGLIVLALASLQTVLLPALREKPDLGTLLRQHRRLLLLFALAVAFCAAVSPWVIPLVDRGRYPDAVPAFVILCVSAVVSFGLGIYAIIALDRRLFRALFWSSAVALLLCVTLNYLLAPRLGAIGAAIATLGYNVAFNGWIAFLVHDAEPEPLIGQPH